MHARGARPGRGIAWLAGWMIAAALVRPLPTHACTHACVHCPHPLTHSSTRAHACMPAHALRPVHLRAMGSDALAPAAGGSSGGREASVRAGANYADVSVRGGMRAEGSVRGGMRAEGSVRGGSALHRAGSSSIPPASRQGSAALTGDGAQASAGSAGLTQARGKRM